MWLTMGILTFCVMTVTTLVILSKGCEAIGVNKNHKVAAGDIFPMFGILVFLSVFWPVGLLVMFTTLFIVKTLPLWEAATEKAARIVNKLTGGGNES